jgi:hypothetical protein
MADYEPVQKALGEGLDPAMLCQTCPWDRPCITPPTMTSAEVKAHMDKAVREDMERAAVTGGGGRESGLSAIAGTLMTAVAFGGKDTAAQVCPVFALRLRSGAGRSIADSLRESMQGWDDQR